MTIQAGMAPIRSERKPSRRPPCESPATDSAASTTAPNSTIALRMCRSNGKFQSSGRIAASTLMPRSCPGLPDHQDEEADHGERAEPVHRRDTALDGLRLSELPANALAQPGRDQPKHDRTD